jgi:hypothetical protein
MQFSNSYLRHRLYRVLVVLFRELSAYGNLFSAYYQYMDNFGPHIIRKCSDFFKLNINSVHS